MTSCSGKFWVFGNNWMESLPYVSYRSRKTQRMSQLKEKLADKQITTIRWRQVGIKALIWGENVKLR